LVVVFCVPLTSHGADYQASLPFQLHVCTHFHPTGGIRCSHAPLLLVKQSGNAAVAHGLEFWKWRPYKVRLLVSNSIYAKKDRNGPPSANQVASKDKCRCSHAVCTLQVHPPTPPVPPFLLTQNLSTKDIAGSDIVKLKVS